MEWLTTIGRSVMSRSRLFLLLTAGLLIGLVSSTLMATTTFAAEATWNGRDLKYNDKTFVLSTDSAKNAKLGFNEDYYVYIESPEPTENGELNVIQFRAEQGGAEISAAYHIVFSFTPPDTYRREETKSITVPPPSENRATTSCDVQGLGWIICPIATGLASAMDTMFDLLKNFLAIPPLETTNQKSGIYLAWNIVRNIANAVFIIVFLIIVYSQITSAGVSNYGIKKMLPRLIISAILVNLSFIISAILLDLSNAAGGALQDMFINLRNTVATLGTTPLNSIDTWEEVTTLVLSNGAVGVGGALAVARAGQLLPFILPLLTVVGLTLLLVLAIMAARQALIVIFIIVSPLAFVAYLLPGTEKLFDKWKDAFLTLLVFFPAFSIVFGGAQLAGAVILQNATGANAIVMHVLGMAVQIAPLIITPLILKLSGGILNRFAGFINNKNRGPVDRSMNWAKDMSEIYKHEQMRKRGLLGRAQLGMYNMGRNRKKRLEGLRDNTELLALQHSRKARMLDAEDRDRKLDKDTLESNLTTDWNRAMAMDRTAANRSLRSRTAKQTADASQKLLDAQYDEFLTGRDAVHTGAMATMQAEAIAASDAARLNEWRSTLAQSSQKRRFADKLSSDDSMFVNEHGVEMTYRNYAGGVAGAGGAAAALASAVTERRKAHDEGVNEARILQDHFKLTGDERAKLAKGLDVVINDPKRGRHTFSGQDADTVEAAALRQLEIGTYQQKLDVILHTNPGYIDPKTHTSGHTFDYRAAISTTAAANGIAKTAAFLGGRTLENITQGQMTLETAIIQTISKGKFKEADLSSNDADAWKAMFELDRSIVPADDRAEFDEGIKNLRYAAWNILNSPMLRANSSDLAIKVLEEHAVRPPSS